MDVLESPACANSLVTVDSWGEGMGQEGRIGASKELGSGMGRPGGSHMVSGQGTGQDDLRVEGDPSNPLLPTPQPSCSPSDDRAPVPP